MSKEPTIIFIEKIFPTYRKPVFNTLAKQIDFRFLTGKNNSGVGTVEANYVDSIPYFQYGKKDTQTLLFPLLKTIKRRPKIVICEFALGILNLPIIILVCKLFKIKIAFWSHGYNRKIGFFPEKKLADKYRLFLMKWVDANIVYSQSDQKLLQQYLPKNAVFVAQNTLDTISLSKIREKFEGEGKNKVRDRLGIRHEMNIVFIGRMLASKKPDLLLDVYSLLKSNYGIKVGVHFIGEGEMLPLIKEWIDTNSVENDFYLHGSLYDPLLSGELLFASDLMINPGDMGLSINHAYCFGCPVVSFETKNGYPAHGPEIEYVIDNKTGFLLKEHSAEALAMIIYEYFKNAELQEAMRKNILDAVENTFPMEKMVNGFLECARFLLLDKNSKNC